MSQEIYDYIICGAGSAGCVVASRLVERTGARVLLLEAGGGDGSLFIKMPAGVSRAIPTKTWKYETEPESATNDRRMTVAQGRVLGGSSSVNGMIYIRGQQQDYDAWAQEHGCTGWDYASMLPYFQRAEANESLSAPYHGTEGPLPVSENRYRHPLSMAFVRAGQESGLPYVNDFNGADQQGVGYYQTTTHNGARASTAQTYLKRVRGSNKLRVLTNALVHRVVIEHGRAVGVEYSRGQGAPVTARAEREVIVSSGAIGTPKILMLSGLGRSDHLRELGIAPIADLPVGDNYHDHMHMSVNASTRDPISLYGEDRGFKAIKNGLDWLVYRAGVVTSNILEGAAFIDTTGEGRPDVQIHFLPVLDTWDDPDGIGSGETHGLTLKVGHLRPKARGSVRLRSRDPRAMPLIHGNQLGHPDDVAGQIRAVRAGLKVVSQPSLAGVINRVFSPAVPAQNAGGKAKGEAFSQEPGQPLHFSDASLEQFVRQTCKTVYHPVGSCRMGVDPRSSVVDLQTRVHGVQGLRVIDCSTFPAIPSGNTNAPTIAVAERAVGFIIGNR